MKIDPLAAIVSLALTLMTGAVLNHWAGLDERIELARHAAAVPGIAQPSPSQPMAPQPWLTTTQPAGLQPVTTRAPQGQPTPTSTASHTRSRVEELSEQLAEVNRDLMELQFRVDTHSESFRPLRATQEPDPSIQTNAGVLPPIEAP